MSIDDNRNKGTALFKSWNSRAMEDIAAKSSPDFCTELADISMDNVFAKFWVRDGLDLRGRSLLTLGILIALQSCDELKVHFAIAIKNGCTIKELEEVIYHATAYAGFPAANTARRAAIESLRAEKLIK